VSTSVVFNLGIVCLFLESQELIKILIISHIEPSFVVTKTMGIPEKNVAYFIIKIASSVIMNITEF